MSQLTLIDAPPSAPPSVESDEWYTTADTSEWARACAGVDAWELDVAACDEAHLARRYFTKASNGLAQEWRGRAVWCNPPFSQIAAWVEKAWLEYNAARFGTLAMLLPAVKTEQAWWQQQIEPFRDAGDRPLLRTYFQPGRAAFSAPGLNGEPVKGSPFGCVLLVWRCAAWEPPKKRRLNIVDVLEGK
jgi:phage N-6-adenine-methyltransferase